MNELVKKVVYTLNLTLPFCFFSIFSLLGLKYLGSQQSLLYWLIAAVVSLFGYFFIFASLISKRYFRTIDILLYLIPFPVLLIYFYTDNMGGLAFQTIILYILFVIPASYIGIELGRNQSINQYAKAIFIVGIIISFGIFMTFPALIATDLIDLVDIFAGGHYQALSYFAGLAFLITTIYFSFYIEKYSLFIVIFFLTLSLGQIGTIVLSGGRGGLVVVVGGILSIVYLKSSKGRFIPYMFVISFSLYILITILLSFDFDQNDRIIKGALRLVSYIDSGGINFNNSSNRDIFYGQAIEYIKESPVYGHGLFTIYDNSPPPYFGLPGFYYPHNFFLEILIHGGILYLFLWLFILGHFFIKLNKIISKDKTQVIILAPFLYAFIQLLFSGTYLQEALFWFSICYVFSFPIPKYKENGVIK